jgi:hypothetical protein
MSCAHEHWMKVFPPNFWLPDSWLPTFKIGLLIKFINRKCPPAYYSRGHVEETTLCHLRKLLGLCVTVVTIRWRGSDRFVDLTQEWQDRQCLSPWRNRFCWVLADKKMLSRFLSKQESSFIHSPLHLLKVYCGNVTRKWQLDNNAATLTQI